MAITKKIIILNGVTAYCGVASLKAIIHLERTDSGAVGILNVYNLSDADNGEYILGLECSNLRLQKFRLGKIGKINIKLKLDADTDLDGRLAVVIAHIADRKLTPVLYGANYAKKMTESSISETLSARVFEPAAAVSPEVGDARNVISGKDNEPPASAIAVSPPAPVIPMYRRDTAVDMPAPVLGDSGRDGVKTEQAAPGALYSDGDVSEIDGYPSDIRLAAEEAAAALSDVAKRRAGVRPSERPRAEGRDDPKYSEWEGFNNIKPEPAPPPHEDTRKVNSLDGARTEREHERGHEQKHEYGRGHEDKANPFGTQKGKYYRSVKKHLDALFSRYPAEDELNNELKGTNWVRVPYSEQQYYVVGLIGTSPEYIAYGVPGRYSLNPPKELESVHWLPLREDDPQGKGYWIMYQDSDSGEAVDLTII